MLLCKCCLLLFARLLLFLFFHSSKTTYIPFLTSSTTARAFFNKTCFLVILYSCATTTFTNSLLWINKPHLTHSNHTPSSAFFHSASYLPTPLNVSNGLRSPMPATKPVNFPAILALAFISNNTSPALIIFVPIPWPPGLFWLFPDKLCFKPLRATFSASSFALAF